jgi:hypothetical protein
MSINLPYHKVSVAVQGLQSKHSYFSKVSAHVCVPSHLLMYYVHIDLSTLSISANKIKSSLMKLSNL